MSLCVDVMLMVNNLALASASSKNIRGPAIRQSLTLRLLDLRRHEILLSQLGRDARCGKPTHAYGLDDGLQYVCTVAHGKYALDARFIEGPVDLDLAAVTLHLQAELLGEGAVDCSLR